MKSKLKLLVILLMSLLLVHKILAQVSEGGTPASFSFRNMIELRSAVEPFRTPILFNVEELKEEDKIAETNNTPLRTAIIIPVELDAKNDGEWTTLPNGQQIWRFTIHAPDAIAMMLYYDEFIIPVGGKLFIYNEDQSHVIGAYTDKTNPTNGAFATEFVAGDKITLEYNAPFTELSTVPGVRVTEKHPMPQIKITGVGYGYNYLKISHYDVKLRIGESDACQVNINCPEGDNWQDQKKGVAKSVTPIGSGSYLCSGTLINNTAQDMTPFFLTASHCFWDGTTTVSTTGWNQIVYYFHYESPGCVTAPPTAQRTVVGAQLLVESQLSGGSDGVLLRLNGNIPLEWDFYFNGWDRRNTAATNGVGIHHPSGDVKKISTFTGPVSSTRWNGNGAVGATNAHWSFAFTATVSGHGVTEGGSSGSPMFNQNGLVVGTLTGGNSACDNLNGSNVYGKLWYHWDATNQATGSGVITANRMMDYLDPLSTGMETLNGTYSVNNLPTAHFTASSANIYAIESIEYTDYSVGATSWQWTFQGGTPATFTGKTPPPIRYTTAGSFVTTLTINSGTGPQETKTENITVVIKGTPALPVADFLVPDLVYSEGFDGAATWSTDWNVVNQAGHESPNTWERGNFTQNFNTIDPGSTASARINWNAAYSDTWLMTADSYLIGQGSSIEFYALYDGAYLNYTQMNFMVSADNGSTWTQLWTTGNTVSSHAMTWSRNAFDLSAYDGQSLLFAWQYVGADGYYMAVDGIKLFGPVSQVTLNVGDYLTPIDLSTGEPVLWHWTFNGATPVNATGETPRVQYLTPGAYDISLTVENTLGIDSKTITNAVTVVDQLPLTAFRSESPGYTMRENFGPYMIPNHTVDFTDRTANYPKSWSWTFTGGSPASSTIQNPQVAYSVSGLYDVTLVTSNTAGPQTRTEPGYVKVGYDSPTRITNVMYGESLTSYTSGTTAAFGSNSNAITLFSERFEVPLSAGYISAVDINCYKTANSDGDMTVAVFSDNNGIPGTQLATTNVTINTSIPTATGSAGAQFVTATFGSPVLVSGAFHIQISGLNSTGAGTSGRFVYIVSTANRGDLAKHTAYVYYNSAWRTVSSLFGMNLSLDIVPYFAYTSSSSVEFDGGPGYALKSNNNPYIPTDGTLNFTDLTTGIPPDTWNWTFPGGTPATSTQQNPQVIYGTQGVYDVTLDVINPEGGTGTLTKTNFVRASLNEYNYIWNLPRSETGTSTYTWTTGQYISGHNSYGITAFAERFEAPVSGGKVSGTQIQFNRLSVSPSGTITVSVYTDAGGFPGTMLVSTDLVANTTNFPINGTGAQNLKTITFPTPVFVGGAYFIVVSGYSGTGTGGVRNVSVCSSAFRDDGKNTFYFLEQGRWVDMEDDSGLYLSLNVAPNFAYSNDIEANFVAENKGYIRQANYGRFIPTGETLSFFDRTSGTPVEWNWTFTGGNPSASTERNPQLIRYSTAGEYDVKLIVKNAALAEDEVESLNLVKAGYDVPDRVWNMQPGENGSSFLTSGSNNITGSNAFGDVAFAERFDAPLVSGYISDVAIRFNRTTATGSVDVSIRKENNGEPGQILASKSLTINSSISNTDYTTVTFDNPVYTDGVFYVVVSGFDAFGAGTLGIHSSAMLPASAKNTAYVYDSFNDWWPVLESWSLSNALSLNIAPTFTYSIPSFSIVGVMSVNRKDMDLTEEIVTVTSNIPWTATSTASWVNITNGSANTNGEFKYTINTNTTPYPRITKIIVAPAGLDLLQEVIIVRQASTYPTGLTAFFDASGDVQVDWAAFPLSAPVLHASVGNSIKSSPVRKKYDGDLLTSDLEVNDSRLTSSKAKYARLRPAESAISDGETEIAATSGGIIVQETDFPPVQTRSSLRAAPAETVIRWDDGANYSAIGVGGSLQNYKLEVATLYTAADMTTQTLPSGISMIKEVEVYINHLPVNGIVLKISQGSIRYHQPVSNSQLIPNAFNTVVLNEPFVLDKVSDTYIGYEFSVNGGMYVAGFDFGPAIVGKGDLIAEEGGPFVSLLDVSGGSISGNWNIAAKIETGRLDNYVLYRNGTEIARTTTPTYTDTDNLSFGDHCYEVTALFGDLESTPSTDDCVFRLSPENDLFTVTPTQLQFAAAGENQDITLVINDPSGYITIHSLVFYVDQPGWLSSPSISGNTYTFTADPNTTGAVRTGVIQVWLSVSASSTCTTDNGYEIPVTQRTALSVGMLDFSLANRTYTGAAQTVNVALNAAYSGLGAITVLYDGETAAPVNAGTYVVSINAPSGAILDGVTNLVLGSFTIDPAPLTIRPNDVTRAFGAANPAFTLRFTTLLGADMGTDIPGLTVTTTATVSSPPGQYPITASGGANPNYTITYTDGLLTVATLDQTIDFQPLPTMYVGDIFDATAISSADLPVTFTSDDTTIAEVTADGRITAKAHGMAIITASNNGDSMYSAASASNTLVVIVKGQDDPTSSELINTSQAVTVYPNPVSRSVSVYVNADIDEALLVGAVILVYTESGVLVQSVQVTGKLTKVDLSVDSGIYLFVLNGKTGITKTMKVIVR